MRKCILINSLDLVPQAWQGLEKQGLLWTFNPCLLKDNNRWILAYRLVGADRRRRIALCELDKNYRVLRGTQIPLSDWIEFPADFICSPIAKQWFADPRLFKLAQRTFLYWNSGWHEPQNCQFLQELDPFDCMPVGPPRELMLSGPRQKIEKNWTFFGKGPFYAVYSVNPHRILEFDLAGTGAITFNEIFAEPWDTDFYSATYGILRGGAVPQLVQNSYYSFCHSNYTLDNAIHYAAAVYRFEATPPFHPIAAPIRPLQLGNPFGACPSLERLNPAVGQVIYPSGAEYADGHWIISYGINDERCALAIIPEGDVQKVLQPIPGIGASKF